MLMAGTFSSLACAQYDLLLRNARIVDGTGAPWYRGDIAVKGDSIARIGTPINEPAARVIDVEGKVVAPGFVDIHTHYDGQVTWDPVLAPSSIHGVTSLVMGNCGVGFAPARPSDHAFLISMLEGVEDIPGTALTEGLTWDWETFNDYLDALDRRKYAVDVATQVAHAPLRAYVMGERGAKNEPATKEDIARQAAIVKEAIRAGALGFSGHGLQQAPAIGRAMKELLVDGGFQTIDLARFGFARIRNRQPLFEKNVI